MLQTLLQLEKNIQQRLATNNRSLEYLNELSYINNTENLSGVTSNKINFKSCDNGLKDYLDINYSNNIADEILDHNRYIIGTFGESNYGLYDLGNKYIRNICKYMCLTIIEKIITFIYFVNLS